MALRQVSGKKVGHIVVYALSACPKCHQVKSLLNDLGLEYYFTDVDILSDENKRNTMVELSRWNTSRSFPTIVIDNKRAVIGFNEAELRKLAAL